MDEQTITDYLLGALPEAEVERLDELSLTDNDFAEQLDAVENDLVDAYVRGELSEKATDRFRSHYLASRKGQEKVRFAQAFHRKIDITPIGATATRTNRLSFPAVSRSFFQWGFAAAALILLLAGSYLMLENLRMRNQMAQMQANEAALKKREQELQKQLAQRSSDPETAKELARVREKLSQLEQQLVEEHDVKLIAFQLDPPARGISKIPELTIPPEIDSVALTLQLESNDFPFYQAQLKDPATGKPLWQTGSIRLGPNSNALPVTLPANLLTTHNYLLEVSGIAENGHSEIISSYPFRVVKQ